MAHSLEIRSPFLDQDFISYIARVPSSLKLHGYESKYLLKKIAGNYLPIECINREKKGFGIPINKWLKNNLNNEVKSALLNKHFLSFNIFNREALNKKLFDTKTPDYNHIWTLLILKYWIEEWF